MSNTPVERHPRTRITRLPYLLVALIAVAVAAFVGSIAWRDRMTSQQEIIGFRVDGAGAQAPSPTDAARAP